MNNNFNQQLLLMSKELKNIVYRIEKYSILAFDLDVLDYDIGCGDLEAMGDCSKERGVGYALLAKQLHSLIKDINSTDYGVEHSLTELELADKSLNSEYSKLIAQCKKDSEWKFKYILNSQRNWIKYRDAITDFVSHRWDVSIDNARSSKIIINILKDRTERIKKIDSCNPDAY